jgi:hypothetical protein
MAQVLLGVLLLQRLPVLPLLLRQLLTCWQTLPFLLVVLGWVGWAGAGASVQLTARLWILA